MIEVRGLTRYYGDFAALHDVSFTAREGQIVGLLGLNGAGKSTTLKILAGLLLPSAGSVHVDGIDLVATPEKVHGRIGYLPENPPLYTDMRVAEFVRHIGRLKGMTAEAVEAALPGALATADLTDRADQVIGTLSHGYRKRVGIAQAIIHDPRLVILDEPISGLDPVQIVEMRKVVRRLAQGRAVLISSHILTEVEQVCDWLVVLADGKVVVQGTEEELGKATVRVEVRGAADEVTAWLEARDDVEKVVPAETHTPEGVVELLVTTTTDNREDLAAGLIQAGFGLRGLSDAGRLEEAFLQAATQREAV